MNPIPRTDLLDVLKRVSPALSNKDFLEVLTCFCFDGENVTAYDDKVIIQAPLKMPFKGAVKGAVLMNFLGATKAKEIKVEVEGDTAIIKAGRAKLNVTTMDEESFLHSFESDGDHKAATIKVTESLVDGFKRCVLTLGYNETQADMLGVTATFSKTGAVLYASDDLSCTRAQATDATSRKKVSVQLDPRWVELFVDACGRYRPQELLVDKNWVEARFKNGMRLFGKACGEANTGDYEGLYELVDKAKKRSELPKGFGRAIDRSLVVWMQPKNDDQQYNTRMQVKDKRIRFHTETPLGRVDDAMKFDHADCSAVVIPGTLSKCLDGCSNIAIESDKFIIVGGDGFQHTVTLGVE